MRSLALALALLVGCGSSAPPTASVAQQVDNPTRAADPTPAPTAGPDVRRYSYDVEDCHAPGDSDLAEATLAVADPAFVEIEGDWLAPVDCAFLSPGGEHEPGALFVDVDGDGHDDALALVYFQRVAQHDTYDETLEDAAVAVVRTQAGATPLVVSFVTTERAPRQGLGVAIEAIEGARFERGLVVVVGRGNCSDCGCEDLEMDYDCRTSPCVYVGHRVATAIEDCESP